MADDSKRASNTQAGLCCCKRGSLAHLLLCLLVLALTGIVTGWAQPASSFHPWPCDHCRPHPARPWIPQAGACLQHTWSFRGIWPSNPVEVSSGFQRPQTPSAVGVFSASAQGNLLLNYKGLLREGRVLKLHSKTYYCGGRKVPQLLFEHHVFSGSF